jgi:adenosylcobinamide kinase/adenosylcobinamide-phosphate guanylyltransferase
LKVPKLTLILGGGRSGKSRYAESLAESICRDPAKRVYLATAEPCDEEMRHRIAEHRKGRESRFVTMEEPLRLGATLRQLPPGTRVVLLDCVTVWLGNLFFHLPHEAERAAEVADLLKVLESPPVDMVLVSNEIGLGVIPADSQVRAFRDMAGWLNQDLAARAARVVLMVAGIPVRIKGRLPRLQGEVQL